ncbi:MAG: RagB/SusD family nutrient uptake outer membrane protein [Bacteroidia bacterium 43-41]|nr:MAG: RagB/SusD family nutrient uptake outer membrane protein [Bacteroidia bacterium 43-41]
MKKYIFLVSLISFFIGTPSCSDYLERDISTAIDEELVNTVYSYSRSRLEGLYTTLPSGFFEVGGAMIASASDEAEHTYQNSMIHFFNTGSWDPFVNPDDTWATYYTGIRNVNLFLANVSEINLDMYRLDPRESQQMIYKQRLEEIEQWKYQARFLRAFYYFELIKRYGGVPIIEKALEWGDDVTNIKRNTLSECVNYIISECDVAASKLYVVQPSAELGKATKGAALALKAKVLLYAASDLWNTPSWAGSYANPELISLSTDNRVTRWKSAADAAKAVIDLSGTGYALANNYRNLFLRGDSYQNSEHILVRRGGTSNSFEIANYPIGFDRGESGTTPSQNLVDAYEVIEDNIAVPFDWNNPVHAASPYSNRDPRLNMNIITNNSNYKGRNVEIWNGGRDGKPIPLASRTGYYLKKYVDENIDLLKNTVSVHSWSLIRLADVYLWYAEALNEYDPGHPDIKIYVDRVRQRQGVNMPALPSGLTQQQMRSAIRHERFVELAFEGHRFWDARRWMIASTVFNSPLKGVEITKTPSNTFNYSIINVENRTFEPKMHFYPIPQQELLKMPEWKQNPLW